MQAHVLDYVVLVVADLDRALTFYTDLVGLSLSHRSGPYAQLHAGTTRLSLYEREAMSAVIGEAIGVPDPGAPAFELGFKVVDCDVAFSELVAAGAAVAVRPTTRPWGQRTAYVRDPDGNLIELAQDLGNRSHPVRALRRIGAQRSPVGTTSRRASGEGVMPDTTVTKVHSQNSPQGGMGQKYLASGKAISMRLWEAEPAAQSDETHARDYETVGFVIAGRAELAIEGQHVMLEVGDSWVVPRGSRHAYRILEPFTAVEATAPPAHVHGRDE